MAKGKKSRSKATPDDKPQTCVLSRRDCTLPTNISFRTQKHGEESVQASDVRVTFEISEDEACAMAKEKYFTRGLFKTVGRGKPDKPLIPKLTIKLETIEWARVSIFLGPNAGGEMKLGVSKLKNPELIFDDGRKITVSTLVQSTPTIGPRIGDLVSRMDGGAQIALEYEHNAEQLEADVTTEQGKPSEGDANEVAARAQVDAFNRGSETPAPETH